MAGLETFAKLACQTLDPSGSLTGQVHAPEVLRRVPGEDPGELFLLN